MQIIFMPETPDNIRVCMDVFRCFGGTECSRAAVISGLSPSNRAERSVLLWFGPLRLSWRRRGGQRRHKNPTCCSSASSARPVTPLCVPLPLWSCRTARCCRVGPQVRGSSVSSSTCKMCTISRLRFTETNGGGRSSAGDSL